MKKSVSFSASGARFEALTFCCHSDHLQLWIIESSVPKGFSYDCTLYGILSIIHHHILKINWIEHIWNSITLNRITQLSISMYSLLQTQRPPFFLGGVPLPTTPWIRCSNREGSHGRRRWKSNGSPKAGSGEVLDAVDLAEELDFDDEAGRHRSRWL